MSDGGLLLVVNARNKQYDDNVVKWWRWGREPFVCLFAQRSCTFENSKTNSLSDREQLLRVGFVQSSFWIPTQDHQTKPETKSTGPPPLPPSQTTHQSFFSFWELAHQIHTRTHKPSLSNTQKNQARYFFLSVSSSALNKTKLLQKHTHKRHTKQSSSSDKTSLQNAHTQNQSCLFLEAYSHSTKQVLQKKHTHTHTHTEKKIKTMFLRACYYHSTKHKSLSTSNQKLQSSVTFFAHIC